MYRVIKVLNHNAMIVLSSDANKRFLVLFKGIGFRRKVAERLEIPEGAMLYSIEETSERGAAANLVSQVDPICLEIAGIVLDEAERLFGRVDRKIIFSMADHLNFAIQRMERGEKISNPLKEDIRLIFHVEYKAAASACAPVRESYGLELTEDEIGFLALHVHSSIENENVSQALQTAQVVRSCIEYIEERTQQKIETTSIGYNRMMNHIRYMVTRMETGEEIKMNLNDYMQAKYPEMFQLAEDICIQMSRFLRKEYQDSEIGYLAMHIARVIGVEA
ncbi:MAG: PRD domain-containing protein [Eubacteriales bacterium]|nr:PRD domain-containing protein [Eubacteriales bacterium]